MGRRTLASGGTAIIAAAGTGHTGRSILLGLPVIPSVAKHVLPVLAFSYDAMNMEMSLAGKLMRKPADGVGKTIDTQGTKPLISSGTTMIPIRAIVESMGGSVDWNAATRRLDIHLGSPAVTMWAGKTTGTAPAIMGGRALIPLHFVVENLGCLVGWDQTTRSVTVVYGG